MDELTQPVITALASALGATVAAFLGVHIAFRRFRRERSYEVRLEWHRNVAEVARRIRNAARSGADISELTGRFLELAEQASIYAPPSTCALISGLVHDLRHTTGKGHQTLNGVELISLLLASDMRKLLGIGRLKHHSRVVRDARRLVRMKIGAGKQLIDLE